MACQHVSLSPFESTQIRKTQWCLADRPGDTMERNSLKKCNYSDYFRKEQIHWWEEVNTATITRAQVPFGIETGIPDNTHLAMRLQKAFQLNNMKATKVTKWHKPISQSARTKAPSVLGEFNIPNRLVKQRSPPSKIKSRYKQEVSSP